MTEETWKEISFDAWTASSIGDLYHLQLIQDTHFVTEYGKEGTKFQCDENAAITNFDLKNIGGWTCLMYAAYYDHADTVRWLLEGNTFEALGRGIRQPVNLGAKNSRKRTALMLAASCGNNETVDYSIFESFFISDFVFNYS